MDSREQLLETISANLKAYRKERGLTQEQLSVACGIPQSHLSKVESGKHDSNLKTLSTIAEVLKMPVRMLLVPRISENLELFEKVGRIKELPVQERETIERVIDMALLSHSQNRKSRSDELRQLGNRSIPKEKER